MNVNARSRTPKGWNRALTAFAVVAAVLAVGLAAMAFTTLSPAAGVVLDPEPVALAPLPSVPATTAPTEIPNPIVPASNSSSTTSAPEPTPTATTEPAPRIPPVEVTISDLDVLGTVRPVGLEESGAMEVPGVTEVGWYLHGAVPGHPGATVLVAHVWWGDTAGPFHRLGALDPGAPIDVRLDDGTVHRYVAVERAMYDKYALPRDLWRNSGPETLVLITCGGDFDSSTNRYEQNIVVYALPIGVAPYGELSSGQPVS